MRARPHSCRSQQEHFWHSNFAQRTMLRVRPTPRALLPKLLLTSLSQRSALQPDDSDPELSRSSSRTSTSRFGRPQTRVACLECRSGKTKVNQAIMKEQVSIFSLTIEQCDGHRPSCARCAKKSATCEYGVEPDMSRLTSIRQSIEALQTELDLLHGLIRYIHTCSDIEAQEGFRRLRACEDPLDVAKSLSN
jgi:hypothetical protein